MSSGVQHLSGRRQHLACRGGHAVSHLPLFSHRPLEVPEGTVVLPLQVLDALLHVLHTGLGLIKSLPLEHLLHVPQVVFQVLQACFCLIESLPDHLADGLRGFLQRFRCPSDVLRCFANLLLELPLRFGHLSLRSETLPLMLRVLACLLGYTPVRLGILVVLLGRLPSLFYVPRGFTGIR
jgi:hypothetical protein